MGALPGASPFSSVGWCCGARRRPAGRPRRVPPGGERPLPRGAGVALPPHLVLRTEALPRGRDPALRCLKKQRCLPFLSDFSQSGLAMSQILVGSIFKRKCCDRTSEGRPKRTRKTTKGDGWRNGKGDSHGRIRGADTDPLIEDDGGSDRYESDSGSDSEGPWCARPAGTMRHK